VGSRRAPPAAAEGNFGATLAALDHAVVVGAPDRGVAYLLDARTGARRQTYRRPSGRHLAGFGGLLAAHGNRVLIGGHLFNARTGRLIASVRANAFAVALVGRRIVAGGPADNEPGYDHGAVRIFAR